jgi:hypothetical protein
MPWRTLDIAPTADEREIRRAYARQLKSRQHEEDAEFFSRLRWAYETTLAWARESSREEDIKEVPGFFFAPPIAKNTAPEEIPASVENLPEEIPTQAIPPILKPDFAPDFAPDAGVPESPVCPPEDFPSAAPDLGEPDASIFVEPPEQEMPPIVIAEFSRDETGHAPAASPEAMARQTPEKQLEELLHSLENLLCANRKGIGRYLAGRLSRTTWEKIRQHPQLETLAEREAVSEKLAEMLNLARGRGSPFIWSQARDFFGWEPPRFSDMSLFAQTLRDLFERYEEAKPLSYKQQWQNRWQKFKAWMLYPYFSLRALLCALKIAFRERPPPAFSPVSRWQAVQDFWHDLCTCTKLAFQFLLGLVLLLSLAGQMIVILLLNLFGQKSGSVIGFLIPLVMWFFAHSLVITLLPNIHEIKALETLFLRYRTATARFFVIYVWGVILLPFALFVVAIASM